LRHETQQHGLVKAARNRSSIAATQDSILTGGAPTQRRHRMRFKLSLRDRTFLHVRARAKLCAPICARAQHRSRKHTFERMRASDSRAGFAVGSVDLRRRTGAAVAFAIRKYLFTTKACVEILRRSACYLCNVIDRRALTAISTISTIAIPMIFCRMGRLIMLRPLQSTSRI
jgi:hypothetical protein